jgi:hypothetical protein
MISLNISKLSDSSVNLLMSIIVKEHKTIYSFEKKTGILKINADSAKTKAILSSCADLLRTIGKFTV